MTKAFDIEKCQVVEAYKLVKANSGSAGIDQQSLGDFEKDLKNNLYKIWNRLSSGSYFPPPVMAVEIPKKSGGKRILGIPTVSDRIAQMVVKLKAEPEIEPYFLSDSYGYRPNKSALDAVGVTRSRCWKYDWVLEFDIKGLFDNIPHDLLMKAVKKHIKDKWVILYVKRWLTADMVMPNGEVKSRNKGTPQGGVISPLLSNLFLHYVFDMWMGRNAPSLPWCRYADDGLVHCHTESQSLWLYQCLQARFKECGLEMHTDKTKIVYCKDANRKERHKITSFDFLGYTFRAREAINSAGKMFINFSPAASKTSLNAMKYKIRGWNLKRKTGLDITDISRMAKPVLNGWLNYYGRYRPSDLQLVWIQFNSSLMSWTRNKHKKLRSKRKAGKYLVHLQATQPNLFPHWKLGNGKTLRLMGAV